MRVKTIDDMNMSGYIRLSDAGVVHSMEDSINQLQELLQKKYLESPPEYTFEDGSDGKWCCDCICGGTSGFSRARSKV